MDLPWGDERSVQFVTSLGLITTNGPYGHNISTDEWTHHISYSPGLIAVYINHGDATNANISKTKEFGVNLAAFDQNVLSSIAGGSHGQEVDKIAALKELGFKFFKAKKIDVLMVEDAALNIECKLLKKIELGDHTMFVGEVVQLYPAGNNQPLIYHGGKYWKFGSAIQKPEEKELKRISDIVEKHRKKK